MSEGEVTVKLPTMQVQRPPSKKVHVLFGASREVQVSEEGAAMSAPTDTHAPLLYTIGGLDDVYLLNGYEYVEVDGERALIIEDADALWKAIGLFLVQRRKILSPKEVRFLRHRMNMSQSELAAYLRIDDQSLARWEKGHYKLPGPADLSIRFLFLVSPIAQPEGLELLPRLREVLDNLIGTDDADNHINLLHTDREWKMAS